MPAALRLLLETSPAEEGRNIILVMLVVGLSIIAVIALGELVHWLRERH